MRDSNNSRQLSAGIAESWEAAVTHAQEQVSRNQAAVQQLEIAAGLAIHAGVKGGIWGSSHGCSNTCNGNYGGC
jgi:hypothetical protein